MSEPEVNEQGSSLMGRRTPFSLKLIYDELWLCMNGGIKMHCMIYSVFHLADCDSFMVMQ